MRSEVLCFSYTRQGLRLCIAAVAEGYSEDRRVRRVKTYKTKSPLHISFGHLCFVAGASGRAHLCVFSSLMMVNRAFSCVVGGSTSALSGKVALLTLLPEAGRQVVMMGLISGCRAVADIGIRVEEELSEVVRRVKLYAQT